jgi:hypothetical protein
LNDCLTASEFRSTWKVLRGEQLWAKQEKTVKQPFMFHYPSVWLVSVLAVGFAPRRSGKQLKPSETCVGAGAVLKPSEIFHGNRETPRHGPTFSRPTG